MGATTPPRFAFRPSTDDGARHPVVVVGAGLVGLSAALDLARRGVRTVVLDDDDTVSDGSRAICFAQRTLEIFGRLGLGARMLAKGVQWNVGRVFSGTHEIWHFDLQPEPGHAYPAFVNLQQYYVEEWLVAACAATGLVDLRWKHRVIGVDSHAGGVDLRMATPAGDTRLTADYLLACDGARSFIRSALDLPFIGQVFRDRFLIADVVMQASFPPERWFWFDPPFHPGQSVLLHRQPDDIWRIDFQLGWDADPELEKQPDRVRARVRAMLDAMPRDVIGADVAFELEWVSVYTFRCRRLERFRHDRVFFLGDAAHQVSPFGARGGNGGVQDADNLAWKLAAVLHGEAPDALLDSYEAERIVAADENILHSTRATDFITPKSPAALAYRDAALALAADHLFARALVNSGRLSRPCHLADSPLNTPAAPATLMPGSPAPDAPVTCDGAAVWLLDRIGQDFCTLYFGLPADAPPDALVVAPHPMPGTLWDHSGVAARRFGAGPGTVVLLRPDQHVAGRWVQPDAQAVAQARRRALAR